MILAVTGAKLKASQRASFVLGTLLTGNSKDVFKERIHSIEIESNFLQSNVTIFRDQEGFFT